MSGFVTPGRQGNRPGGFGCYSFLCVILCHFVPFLPEVRLRRETSGQPTPERYKYDRDYDRDMVAGRCRSWKGASVRGNCSGLRGAEWLMAEYGGWVTLGDESPKPSEKSGSWLKPIHLTKSELLRVRVCQPIITRLPCRGTQDERFNTL